MSKRVDALFAYVNIGPHIAAWLQSSAHLQRIGVLEVSDNQTIYGWERCSTPDAIEHRVLSTGMDAERAGRDRSVIERAVKALNEMRPRALLVARYDLPLTRALCDAAKSIGTKRVLMSDTWAGSKTRWRVKEAAKRRMLQAKFDAVMVAGSRSLEYAKSMGFRAARIGWLLDVVDNAHFASRADSVRNSPAEWKQKLSLPEEFFVVVARHSIEKNLGRLLEAYSCYRKGGGRTGLVLLGAGPLTGDLRRRTAALGLAEVVQFKGWVQYQDTPIFIALAKALALVSTEEPWGLVVNEALASGTPVVVSTAVGSSADLVRHGWNGWIVDGKDIEDISEGLSLADATSTAGRDEMGQRGRLLIGEYTLENRAHSISALLERICDRV